MSIELSLVTDTATTPRNVNTFFFFLGGGGGVSGCALYGRLQNFAHSLQGLACQKLRNERNESAFDHQVFLYLIYMPSAKWQ